MLVIARSRVQIHRPEAIGIFSWVKSRTIKSTPTCRVSLKTFTMDYAAMLRCQGCRLKSLRGKPSHSSL